MWRILVLLLFAKESAACGCPGITINGTDQPYCWQVVKRNASTWSSADDACSAVGSRMGQPEDNETLIALAPYLEKLYTLPIITGYVLGNAQTVEIAVVCRANQFHSVANDTDGMIRGVPSEAESCVFITKDFVMHFGPCSTAAVVLCSQPVESDDYCSVAPTCSTPTTADYNATNSFRRATGTADFDNSSTTTSVFTGSTLSSRSTTTGNDSNPVSTTTTLLPPTTTINGGNGGGGGGTTTQSSKSARKSGGVWLFGWCVPWWLITIAAASLFALALCLLIVCLHWCCGLCVCCKSHEILKAAPPMRDVEKGPVAPKNLKDGAIQTDPEQPQITLPPQVTQPNAVIPVPIPIDYRSMVDAPVTDDKGIQTEPWEPLVVYRDREPEPRVTYEQEDRMMLPPAPITARTEAPQFMESDDEIPRLFVAGPTAVIVRSVRRRREPSPDLATPRDPFPVLPRRALTDEDLPREAREPKEKKREKLPLEPIVFLHNARPEERPVIEEPELLAASRGPRAFPPPPPMTRSTAEARPFPEQFKSPSPGPKASRPLPPPPIADPPKRSPSPIIAGPPPKQSRPLTRTPVNRTVINQEPASRPERRTALPPPPASTPLPADPPSPPAKAAPARSTSGGGRPAAAALARARSSSPPRRAAAPPRSSSPFAPKQNAVSPTGGGGSLFKAAPAKESAANLRAANGKMGGVAGGHGEVPRGWKAWSPNAGAFSSKPGPDI